ncbi:RNA polymerase sigma factor [Flavivirga spongiicola]|uniref:RNA polymerase sigma-70 factor n=1 Tax=Flavivirga spongiicola TaxID=421621 RepID=A0ABU7XTR4_9FLAO|nr:RNA polymerase sigma-70 factor [Flavivirga sp. MEBiC05379]MDO5979177.1 RNA polymerase sigma-70 factor [Flavivirga sp. MEBiC05379]
MDDLVLIKAIQQDDYDAFRQLFNKYHKPLLGYITTHTNDLQLSKDILQQTFIIVWEQRQNFNISKSFKSYLYSVAFNKCMNYYRKQKRQLSFVNDLREIAIREAIIDDNELIVKRIDKLEYIIEALPPRCKEILRLNKFEGLKYREIAERLQISIKTVESQISIALKKIRKGFESDKLIMFFIKNMFSVKS